MINTNYFKYHFFFLNLLIAVLLSACATTPTMQNLRTADYGARPDQLEAIISKYLSETLIDPDSLKNLKIGVPKKGWTHTNYGKDILYGYWVYFSYNAKNRYGGYVGQTTSCAFIKANHIDQVWKGNDCQLFVRITEE